MPLNPPNSPADICNLALDYLKQAQIVNITPATSKVEELCARWYPQTRRSLLRSHPWNFAARRVSITPSSSLKPAFGFTHGYALPNDWLRFISRHDSEGNKITIDVQDYDIEGRVFMMNGTDNTAERFRYITDLEDVTQFDPLFIEAFALTLALKFAPKHQGTENRLKALVELRVEAMQEAKSIDGQERPPRRVQNSKFIQARRSIRSNTAGQFTVFEG